MFGKRHKMRLSREALPTSYSGWYYGLKMPLMRDFDKALAWLLDTGMYKVKKCCSYGVMAVNSVTAAVPAT